MAHKHEIPSLDESFDFNPELKKKLIFSAILGIALVALGAFLISKHWSIGVWESAAHGADNYPGDKGYELIDFEGMKKALDSISPGQLLHIVYMSSIYVERSNPPMDFPGRPLYWKRRAEQLIQESGNAYTIIRASWLNNNHGGILGINAEQGDQGDGKITREDVAEMMVQAMHSESAKGKVFEVYNVPGTPINNWDNFFSKLQLDAINT